MKYTSPYAPNNFNRHRSGNTPNATKIASGASSSGMWEKSNVNMKNSKQKPAKTSVFATIFAFIILAGLANAVYQHIEKKKKTNSLTAISPIADSLKSEDKKFLEPQEKEMRKERVLTISEELAQRITNHSNLPIGRGINIAWIEETQQTNQQAMDQLLEKLSIEIGSSEALGILRTIKENRAQIAQEQALIQSQDPQIARQAKEKVNNIKQEIDVLTLKLAEAYNKEGFDLTEEQVKSLTKSPHGEEASYMINGFQNIKTICFEMENRLRKFPTQEMARKYYGTYHVLLLALDRIQRNMIDKMSFLYLPETAWVRDQAETTKSRALNLLQEQEALRNLSSNQKAALQFNIESCDQTITKAMKTERKLQQSLSNLESSNNKLQYSIAAAENSHTAMLLHTEIARIGEEHQQEIEQLRDITLPDMVAADFSDADDPWLSPVDIRPVAQ